MKKQSPPPLQSIKDGQIKPSLSPEKRNVIAATVSIGGEKTHTHTYTEFAAGQKVGSQKAVLEEKETAVLAVNGTITAAAKPVASH